MDAEEKSFLQYNTISAETQTILDAGSDYYYHVTLL